METITLAEVNKKRRVSVTAIEYFEGVGNYTYVHLKGEKPVMLSKTLLRFAEQLPGFIRIHKKTLVNPDHILEHRTTSGKMPVIRLSGNRSLVVSRRRVSALKQQLSTLA